MNTFVPNAPFLYPLKTSENLTVFELRTNGLININNYCTHFIKLAGWQLSGVATGWIKIFPGVSYPGGKFPGGNFPGGSFPGWELSGWGFSGWEIPWVGVVCVGIFRVEIFLGGNCPGGTYPGWEFSLVEVFQVGIVRWESSGWQFSGWEFPCYQNEIEIFRINSRFLE